MYICGILDVHFGTPFAARDANSEIYQRVIAGGDSFVQRNKIVVIVADVNRIYAGKPTRCSRERKLILQTGLQIHARNTREPIAL